MKNHFQICIVFHQSFGSQCLDTAHTCCHTCFGNNLEGSDGCSIVHVCSTAKFLGEFSHADHPDIIAKPLEGSSGVGIARYTASDWQGREDAFLRELLAGQIGIIEERLGYPVIVKPDNGVGASRTYKLKNEDEFNYFFATKDQTSFIMEEFVNGTVHTYDAVIDSKGNPLFETGNVTMDSIMDTVNLNGNSCYYIEKHLPDAMRDVGRRTVAAFGVKSRFVHLEFFVLNDDQPALGKKGDILGLEVNMRPSGGFSADMFNFANSTDVYKIWADMVAFDRSTMSAEGRAHYYCCYCGRRDGKNFVMDHDAIMARYGNRIKMVQRIPKALSGAMADMMYLANLDTPEEKAQYYADLLATR